MNRSLVSVVVLAASGVIGWICPSAAAESPGPARRPNVVLILADDLGWADVGCYGSDLHQTRHVDRLAQQGMRFTDAYAASPVCSPTRASILTGKHPARLGMTIWREGALNPPRVQALARASRASSARSQQTSDHAPRFRKDSGRLQPG